ncbi:hypothetical protein B7C42_02902 [Nocardia cerradoensis]|uniref:Lipoprotein n=1 Tax=Nocardia cerradoensis TaxID=85688 RepID=A0A231H7X6_9NOCA|nr:hypothetical protein [Nocardia cerradoensis]OXR44945.1 hypothetical protein B7C42_02902 [Nocardia cerradoensis]
MNGDTIRRGSRPLFGAAAAAALLMLAGCGSSDSGNARPADSVAPKATTTGTVPEVIDCSFSKPAVRPENMILACADLGAQVEQIVWQSWGPDQAQGDGVERENTCDPNCAAGKYITKKVHLTLTDVARPGNVFTKVTTVDADGHTYTWPRTPR